MTADKGNKGGQKRICAWTAINALKHSGIGQSGFAFKQVAQRRFELSAVKSAQKAYGNVSAGGLIAEYITQRRNIPDNGAAVIEAGVRPRAENAGNSAAMAKKAAGGSKQIALDFNGVSIRQAAANPRGNLHRCHARSIEINSPQPWQTERAETLAQVCRGCGQGIDSGKLEFTG